MNYQKICFQQNKINNMKKISIIVPVYNEEKTIFQILKSVQKAFENVEHEIIIVDDGSKDQTQNICQTICLASKNIQYIRLQKNYGKGYALRVGFTYALGQFIAIQDADLEYNPLELRKLFNQVKDNIAVYGKRNRKNGYLFYRMGVGFLSWFCNFLYQSHLFDIYTCYKIIPAQILKSLKLSANGFEIEAEITAKLLKKNIPIKEIPITYFPRTFKDGKHIRARDGIIGLWTLIKNKF